MTPVTPGMVVVGPNCPEQPHLKSPPRHPPSHGPGTLFWLSPGHSALSLSHTELWFVVSLVCPWTLFLVPGSGLHTETLWDGAHWGGLSLGSAQLLAQPYLYFCSLTSPLRRVALGLILSSSFMALCVDPMYRSFFPSVMLAIGTDYLSQWALQWRQHTAGQYITACEHILRAMSSQVGFCHVFLNTWWLLLSSVRLHLGHQVNTQHLDRLWGPPQISTLIFKRKSFHLSRETSPWSSPF